MMEKGTARTSRHWRIDVPFIGENRVRAIVAVTGDQFYMASFVTGGGLDEADRELEAGADPAVVLGKKKISRSFALRDVTAVEKTDFNQSVYVLHRKPNGAIKTETIPTYTQSLYAKIFDALHERLAPTSTIEQTQASVGQAALKPGVFVTLAVLATAFFYWIALEAASGKEWHPVGSRAGLKVMIYEALHALGPGGELAVGGAAILLTGGWLAWRIIRRPVRTRFCVQSPP